MMAAKKSVGPTSALVTVITALEALNDADRRWVLQAAGSKFVVEIRPRDSDVGTRTTLKGISSGGAKTLQQLDPKSFVKSKAPQSDIQRVACLAYYLNHVRGVEAFKTAEITKLNTDARGPDFNISRALDNASRANCGYLSPIGKGQKQLSAIGEELVDALPSQEAAKAVDATKRRGKRGKTKRSGKH